MRRAVCSHALDTSGSRCCVSRLAQCDAGRQWGGTSVSGCDDATCRFQAGWRCQQPGSPGLPEAGGTVPMPGPGGTQTADTAGAVPLSCWCANPAGSWANTSTACAVAPCPYPERCVDATPGVAHNGTVCARGSEGLACIRCSPRWYRSRDACLPCPAGVPAGVVLLSLFAAGAHARQRPAYARGDVTRRVCAPRVQCSCCTWAQWR
jgi:hypothetical protein